MESLDTSPKIADGISSAAAAQGSPRQVATGTLIAALVLALFASRGLQSWADAKGDSTLADLVGDGVERWSDGIERLGLTIPHDALRQAIRRAENAGWD
jgi:hypothetical protein